LEQDEIDALARQEILRTIEERRLIFVRNNEGRINLVNCATAEEFRELLGLPPPRGKYRAPAITGKQLCLNIFAVSASPGRSLKMTSLLSCQARSQGAIMFNHRAAGQRIFPSELSARSMTRAPAPTTTSDSNSADLAFLHHMSDDERKGNAGEKPLRIQISGPTGFNARGYMFRRLNLRP
jgi:hypothetical protein